jgi:hypothetical protein
MLARAVVAFEGMGDPARRIPPTAPDDTDAARAGQLVLEQLHALGMTDEEIAAGAPVDVSHEAVVAWLEGRSPCPYPR